MVSPGGDNTSDPVHISTFLFDKKTERIIFLFVCSYCINFSNHTWMSKLLDHSPNHKQSEVIALSFSIVI